MNADKMYLETQTSIGQYFLHITLGGRFTFGCARRARDQAD
jgi:hypothetical protein